MACLHPIVTPFQTDDMDTGETVGFEIDHSNLLNNNSTYYDYIRLSVFPHLLLPIHGHVWLQLLVRLLVDSWICYKWFINRNERCVTVIVVLRQESIAFRATYRHIHNWSLSSKRWLPMATQWNGCLWHWVHVSDGSSGSRRHHGTKYRCPPPTSSDS